MAPSMSASTRLDTLPPLSSLAVFLDIDGTLLEIAATPSAVRVEPEVTQLLARLHAGTGGALALISGRSVEQIDSLFRPLKLPAAGLHGFERRDASGAYEQRALPAAPTLERARRALQDLAAGHPGVYVEDKRFALALHYRSAPELGPMLAAAMAQIAAEVRPQLELQLGRMIAELRPSGSTKGEAVRTFMAEPPFEGRFPVFAGDDLTDECAFEWVNSAGGLSVAVAVGRPTAARVHLPDVTAVRRWLAQMCEGSSGGR